MKSYLSRYQSGDYKKIWDELVSLGDAVRHEDIVHDVADVVHETMQRIQANIELLIPRLVALQYTFGYDWLIHPNGGEPFDVFNRQRYLDAFHWKQEQPPIFIAATQEREEIDQLEQYVKNDPDRAPVWQEQINDLVQTPTIADFFSMINEAIGPFPLSIESWYKTVGSINLCGIHEEWYRSFQKEQINYMEIDPLQVLPITVDRAKYYSQVTSKNKETTWFGLAPDLHFKHRRSGGGDYFIEIPNSSIDATLRGERHELLFIDYLRFCFKWGGFPGLDLLQNPPLADIAFLTQDMLPF